MSEERAAAVLRVLDADLPPSTVDLDRAVRAGRRRERARRGLMAGALAGVTVLAGAAVVTVLGGNDASPPVRTDSVATGTTAATQCVPAALPGQRVEVGAVSPDGRLVVGETHDPAGPLLWTDGTVTPVTVPAGVTATAHAVNDAGVIVGQARRNDRTIPFAIRAGVYSELPLPAGAQGAANGVDPRGDVVGAFWDNGDTKAVLWKASGAMTTLISPTEGAGASAIGDDGTVFGSLGDGGTPYAWAPDGTGRALPGTAGSGRGKAMGVAGDYVYGHVGAVEPSGAPSASRPAGKPGGVGGGEPRWVRWQLSTGAVVEPAGLSAAGVDGTGAVVGAVRVGEHFAPARWREGRIDVLRGLDGRPGTGRVVATSRDGSRLVGHAGTGEATVAVLWRCS